MGPDDSQEGAEAVAPYGQACTNCARTKRKCLVRPGGKCERCQRLDKECTPIASARKPAARKRIRPSTRRRTRLEDNLDDLVSLLRAQQATTGPVDTVIPAHPALPAEYSPTSRYASFPITPTSVSPYQKPYDDADAIDLGHVQSHSAVDSEALLRTFRTRYLASFPFIFLPTLMTAAQLQVEKPFLWSVIFALCTEPLGERFRHMRDAQTTLAQEVVVDARYNIDLLLGLLVASSWPYLLYVKEPPLPLLMNLAATLVHEIRIDRPTSGTGGNVTSWSDNALPKETRTNEERRALIACFVLASTLSPSVTRNDLFLWSDQLEDDVGHLWRNSEWLGDRKIVALARIWKGTNKANTLAHGEGDIPTNETPVAVDAHILQASLEQVQCGIPADIFEDKMVLAHFYSAQVLNYEIALSLPASDVISANDFRRLDYLFLILQAARSLLDTYLSFTPSEVRGCSMSMIMQVIRGLCVLYKISAIEDSAWDSSIARGPADILSHLDQFVDQMWQAHIQLVSALELERDEPSCFSRAVDCWNWTRPRWVEVLAESADSSATVVPNLDTVFLNMMNDV